MRRTLALIVMLGWPVLAAAQSAPPPHPAPSAGGVVPLPPIGLPLPQIGLPLPPIGLPPAEAPQSRRDANRRGPRTKNPRGSAAPWLPVYGWPYIYEVPVASSSLSDSAQARPVRPPAGRLQFDIAAGGEPQLYVDGYYMGTLADFASGVELEAGPHAVELRTPGFETLTVPVNVTAGRTMTYRGSLTPTDATPAPPVTAASAEPAAPAVPMVGYIVPGCYIGNVPPQDAGLPATCDLSRTITIKQ